jgi:hypothetical protein
MSQYLAKISEPSPLQKKREAMALKDLDYFSQDVPDYSKPPSGLIYADEASQAAQNKRFSDRTAIGAAQMGAHGANPGLSAVLKEQTTARHGEQAALAKSDALSARRSEAMGSSIPLINASNSRALGLGNTAMQIRLMVIGRHHNRVLGGKSGVRHWERQVPRSRVDSNGNHNCI